MCPYHPFQGALRYSTLPRMMSSNFCTSYILFSTVLSPFKVFRFSQWQDALVDIVLDLRTALKLEPTRPLRSNGRIDDEEQCTELAGRRILLEFPVDDCVMCSKGL